MDDYMSDTTNILETWDDDGNPFIEMYQEIWNSLFFRL